MLILFTMDYQDNNELQQLYKAAMADQSAFTRGRRALFDDDYEQAQQCFRQAVSEGHAEAMTYLGYMYRKGLGVRRDDAKPQYSIVKPSIQVAIHSLPQLLTTI